MRPQLIWFVTAVVFSILRTVNTRRTVSPDDAKIQKIDSLIRELLACGGDGAIPGLALSVVYGGRVLVSRGYGTRDLGHHKPVTDRTLFGIGPVTQTFTSTLLAKLLHQHSRFSMETPLKEILPGKFRFYDNMRTRQACAEDLLGQRMGLVRHSYMVFQDFLTRKRLAFKMRNIKRAKKFRGSFINSDVMYSLAAYVTEAISSATWEQLVSRKLLRPLKMAKSTFFTNLNPNSQSVAKAYYHDNTTQREISLRYFREATKLGGAQSMVSSASDMAKWMLFLLSGGRNREGDVVVPREVLETTYTRCQQRSSSSSSRSSPNPHTLDSWRAGGVCLGWTNGTYRDYHVLSSTQSTRSLVKGYQSRISLVPSQRLGIFTAFSGNRLSPRAQTALHAAMADVVLGEEAWLNSTSICSYPRPGHSILNKTRRTSQSKSEQKRPTNQSQAYTGVYFNSIYGRIILYQNETLGRLQLQYGRITSVLQPASRTAAYVAQGVGEFWLFKVTVTFHRPKRGKPRYLSISEFVPNYPDNPIRFKQTDTKVPDEYSRLSKLNITTPVQSVTPGETTVSSFSSTIDPVKVSSEPFSKMLSTGESKTPISITSSSTKIDNTTNSEYVVKLDTTSHSYDKTEISSKTPTKILSTDMWRTKIPSAKFDRTTTGDQLVKVDKTGNTYYKTDNTTTSDQLVQVDKTGNTYHKTVSITTSGQLVKVDKIGNTSHKTGSTTLRVTPISEEADALTTENVSQSTTVNLSPNTGSLTTVLHGDSPVSSTTSISTSSHKKEESSSVTQNSLSTTMTSSPKKDEVFVSRTTTSDATTLRTTTLRTTTLRTTTLDFKTLGVNIEPRSSQTVVVTPNRNTPSNVGASYGQLPFLKYVCYLTVYVLAVGL